MRVPVQKCVAEFVGTFALVFIGCGACIAHHHHSADITHVGVALAFGGVVMCMVYAFGHISGAHFNPAVTIAFSTISRFPRSQVVPYVLAQLLGATTATLGLLVAYGTQMAGAANYGSTVPFGTTQVGVFILEFALTFFLMIVIMAVATDSRAPKAAMGLAIGGAVTFGCLAAGKCCGASMNPARSLGPALFAGQEAIKVLWLYVVAPIAGAVVAAVLYEVIRGDNVKQPVET